MLNALCINQMNWICQPTQQPLYECEVIENVRSLERKKINSFAVKSPRIFAMTHAIVRSVWNAFEVGVAGKSDLFIKICNRVGCSVVFFIVMRF